MHIHGNDEEIDMRMHGVRVFVINKLKIQLKFVP